MNQKQKCGRQRKKKERLWQRSKWEGREKKVEVPTLRARGEIEQEAKGRERERESRARWNGRGEVKGNNSNGLACGWHKVPCTLSV